MRELPETTDHDLEDEIVERILISQASLHHVVAVLVEERRRAGVVGARYRGFAPWRLARPRFDRRRTAKDIAALGGRIFVPGDSEFQ